MGHVLDLTNTAWKRDCRGGITLIGTWLAQGDRHRPCMVIIRTGEEMHDDTIPCIITVDKAWIWSEEIGDPRQAARMSMQFAEALRLDVHNPKVVIRLTMTIADHLGDLLHIPPYQPRETTAVAEMTVTDHRTGRTKEVEIRDDV